MKSSEMTDVENPDLALKVEEEQETGSEEVEEISEVHKDVAKDDIDKKTEKESDRESEEELPILSKVMNLAWRSTKIAAAILLVVYLLAAFIIDFKRATALFTITVLVVVYNLYAYWVKKNEEKVEKAEDALIAFMKKTDTEWKTAAGFTGVLVLIMVIIMAITVRDGRNMVSLFGMLVFLGLTWLFSWKPSKVQVRPVIGSIFIQFIFGYVVIRTSWGLAAMQFLSDTFTTLLGYTVAGSSFVFAWLTDGSLFGRPFQLAPDADGNDMGVYFLGPPFFFNVLPTVIFFSSLMSIGYYTRALPWIVRKVGYFLGIILGTSASESLSAAGNIFIGQTEAPLLVRVSYRQQRLVQWKFLLQESLIFVCYFQCSLLCLT